MKLGNKVLRYLKIWSLGLAVFGACMMISTNVYASSKDTTETQIKKLKQAKITSVVATNKGTVELKWKKVSGANKYKIYRKKKGEEKYKQIFSTTKTSYVDKKGKSNVTYLYRIKPVKLNSKKKVIGEGKESPSRKCKVRKKNPKIAYAGDSIMTGLTCYNILKGRKNTKVFAAVGMNTGKFASSKQMKDLLKYNPDRLYIMLGVNSMWSGDSKWLNKLWGQYEEILEKCRKKNPHMEIIVVGVAPVKKNASVSNSAIKKFNKILKTKVPKKTGMYYCDIKGTLADSNGYLRSKYSAGDGVHWKIDTYRRVLKKWDQFSEKITW